MSNNNQDYQIFIGLGKSKLKKYFIKRKYIPKLAQLCSSHNFGYSILDVYGGYAKNNTYINEYTLVIFISQVSEDTIRAFAKKIVKEINQDSVMLRKVNAQSEFIFQD